MPRWDGSGAEHGGGWLADSLRHAMTPMTRRERRAQRSSRNADESYFRANPHAGSYVRPYVPGEIAPAMLEGRPGAPVAVAVALVRPGLRVRVAVFQGESRATARLLAERQAKALRLSVAL